MFSKRRARHWGPHGQREAEEGAQAPDHLLQLPAGSAAEEIPVGTVPGAAGASRAGGPAGPHADSGQAAERTIDVIKRNSRIRILSQQMFAQLCADGPKEGKNPQKKSNR